jgi:hypothetical protein
MSEAHKHAKKPDTKVNTVIPVPWTTQKREVSTDRKHSCLPVRLGGNRSEVWLKEDMRELLGWWEMI